MKAFVWMWPVLPSTRCCSLLPGVVLAALLAQPTWAGGFHSPEDCQAYSGEAHLQCLYALIEIQQGKISKLEGEMKAQGGSLRQLREEHDRQAAATADMQRRLEQQSMVSPPVVQVLPPVYVWPRFYPGYYPGYVVPAPGLSLYFGAPYYGPRFFGPPSFRHCRGPWRSC